MRVLIIDDHPLFADGLRLLLQTLAVATDVQTCTHAHQALQMAATHPWDLILLDWNLGDPAYSGTTLLAALRQLSPATRVVVVSAESGAATVNQAIDAGAVGFVPKETGAHLLIEAIRLTAQGGIYLPVNTTDTHADDSPAPSAPTSTDETRSLAVAFPSLTQRQTDVLVCALRGEANKAIARELDIAEDTVKQHLKAVYAELNVRNRAEAIYLVARQGLKVF